MGKTEYNLIWKEGSFFEKGHWRLVPKESDNGFIIAVIFILILVLLVSIGLLSIPLWAAIIGFQMIREKRYVAGIFGVIGFIYFMIDLNNEWFSSLLFYGWTDSDGELTKGIFGLKGLNIFKYINFLGLGLSLGYILDCILITQFGKKFNNNRVTMPQIVVYITPMIISVFSLILLNNSSDLFNTEKSLFSTAKPEYPENGIYEEKYDDGQLRKKGVFKNGEKNGEWISYHFPSDQYGLQIQEISNYSNGIEEGFIRVFGLKVH
jgi:hypothetical protein